MCTDERFAGAHTEMSPNDVAALLETRANETSLEQALIEHAERLAVTASTDDGLEALKGAIERAVASDGVHHVDKETLETAAKKDGKGTKVKQYLRVSDKPIPDVCERDGEPVTVYKNEPFMKKIVPKYTFAPRTRQGVVSVVKWAREKKLRVRATGARMSTAQVYGATGDVLISLTPLGLPGRLQQAEPRNLTDLERIQMVRVENRGHTGLVRIGAAATADHFRRWATAHDGGDWRWMLDALPAVPAATSAGWTQMACYGGGVAHTAVCDLVVAMEFVNYLGEIQTITDAKVLRAASAGFGVFGVVLSQTFRVNKLQLATMRPHKVPAPLAIPPPSRAFALHTDDFDAGKYSDAQLEDARKEFVEDAARFQCQWTWYPFAKDVFVNAWDTRAYSADSRPSFPTNKEVRWQRAHAGISELFGRTALRLLPRVEQARLFSKTVMAALPTDKRIDASVPDAMLFRRGVERFPSRRVSMLIPIPLDDNGKLDLFVVQKAWWMAINEVYVAKRGGRAPLRVAVEMCVTGGSETLLAPHQGNAATCAIELRTQPGVDDKEWRAFVQCVVDRWATLRDPVTNDLLRVRPHWAMEWPLKIRGQRTKKYLRDAYAAPAADFLALMRGVAKEGGYELDEMIDAFGNEGVLDILGYQKKKSWLPGPLSR